MVDADVWLMFKMPLRGPVGSENMLLNTYLERYIYVVEVGLLKIHHRINLFAHNKSIVLYCCVCHKTTNHMEMEICGTHSSL